MKKLPKEKRDHLILVCMGTLALLILIVYGLIIPQYRTIAKIRENIGNTQKKLQDMETAIKRGNTAASDLSDLTGALANAERDMAVGDPNAWIYNTIRNFKGRYKVDISVSGQSAIGDVDLLPKFPYKQLKVAVSGTAYYHDFGKFIADFENTYPHTRIENLTMEPAGNPGDNNEKLTFRMDIIALVKSGETSS